MDTSASGETSEDDARAEHISLMDELRDRVRKAETASEEYQRQLNLLQARLEDSQHEQGQVEDRLYQSNVSLEELESDRAQAMRQKREMQDLYDAERTAMLKDQADYKTREEELLSANQRLKEALAQREMKNSGEDGTTASQRLSTGRDNSQFAPAPPLQRQDTSKQVQQKDRVIESLRLELAEAQIKIMELDSDGGGRVHELEKRLLEMRITNARLLEDNESFQLLLSEKTLNGDFSKTEAMQQSSNPGSLAEELGTEELDSAEAKSDDTRRLEAEVKSLKDQNKALALYIENIIGRLLSHNEFENILEKNPDMLSGVSRPQVAPNRDKELPPPPPAKDDELSAGAGGFLQRAVSVVKRPRPASQIISSSSASTSVAANENAAKPPSVPTGRAQSAYSNTDRYSQSDITNVAPLVNQMYRGPPSGGSGPGPLMSPGISPGVTTATRTAFFSPPGPSSNATSRAPSSSFGPREANTGSSANSTFSDHSGGLDGSPPRSTNSGTNNYTGAVMTQSKLRPLRLVQENPAKEEDMAAMAARKKANRGSWLPNFFMQKNENAP